jgi:hypothetical protein
VALAAIAVLPSAARAQSVTIDLMTGGAYNITTPLTIHQDGHPDIDLTARFDTKPFGPFAPYYSWRVDFWRGDAAWEIQQVHHRLFLSNTTADVQQFDIHFGYNYFLAGRAWRARGFVLHASGGVVVPNPVNIVRGLELNTGHPGAVHAGYSLGGVGGALAASRTIALFPHVNGIADGGFLAGWVSVPVVNGSAHVPNLGFHGHVGLELVF